MIEIRTGNIFEAGTEALVDPVNCYGVNGAGLALEFKRRWPWAVSRFWEESTLGIIKPGHVYVEATSPIDQGNLPRYLLFFTTKNHWRDPSRIEWINHGLYRLVAMVQGLDIRSIAIPALGCGCGLTWADVQPLIDAAARRMQPMTHVHIYLPKETP